MIHKFISINSFSSRTFSAKFLEKLKKRRTMSSVNGFCHKFRICRQIPFERHCFERFGFEEEQFEHITESLAPAELAQGYTARIFDVSSASLIYMRKSTSLSRSVSGKTISGVTDTLHQ